MIVPFFFVAVLCDSLTVTAVRLHLLLLENHALLLNPFSFQLSHHVAAQELIRCSLYFLHLGFTSRHLSQL